MIRTALKLRLTRQQYAVLCSSLTNTQNTMIPVTCGIGHNLSKDSESFSLSLYKIHCSLDIDLLSNAAKKESPETEAFETFLKQSLKEQQCLMFFTNDFTLYNNGLFFKHIFNKYAKMADELISYAVGYIDSEGIIHSKAFSSKDELLDTSVTTVVGGDIQFWFNTTTNDHVEDYKTRTVQTYGVKTTNILSQLTIGIIGASGTGSPTIEMLHRLGVGKLVICDSDIIEPVNLNRIYYSSLDDAQKKRLKVDVIKDSINSSGLGTEVITISQNCVSQSALRELSQCDVIFGCVDSIQARDYLNRLSVYYTIPYFDLGIKLIADGIGGISHICGSVHFLKPDGPSFLTRGVFTLEQLRAEAIKNNNPAEYEQLKKEKYIQGVNVSSPAVISVNTLVSSLGVNDFLARIHPHRNISNDDILVITADLNELRLIAENTFAECHIYSKYLGRGDLVPLLNMPELSR